MRPRELVVRGFRSYAAETTFRFDERGLVGIVGPIGSGKSSILDAISFALFGKTARIERDTKTLISQRRDAMHVALTFTADGTTWKAVRAIRRGGAPAHALYRITADGEEAVADKKTEVDRLVEAALGMDFATFNRSVLLAQGQFSAFLEATPVDRDKVLKGVFGFDRLDAMRDVAKVRLDGLGVRLQALAARRASGEADRLALAEKRVQLVAAEERASILEALRTSVDQADGVLQEANGRVRETTAALDDLDRFAVQVPTREATEGIFAGARGADATVTATEETLATASHTVSTAAAAVAAAVDAAGGRAAIARAGDLLARLGALDEAAERERAREQSALAAVATAEAASVAAATRRDEAAAAVAAAALRREEAVSAEAGARAVLHAAHDADRAYALRSTLEVGAACPVCTRVVESLPGAGEAGDVTAAEAGLAAAVAAADEARRDEAAAQATLAAAEASLAAAADRVAAAIEGRDAVVAGVAAGVTERDAILADLSGILGAGDPTERMAALRQGIASAEDAEREARAGETAARQARDDAVAVRDRVRRDLTAVATAVSHLAGRLGIDLDPGEGPDAVEAALVSLREAWVVRRAGVATAQEDATRSAAAAATARRDLLVGAGMSADDDVMEIAAAAGREATTLGAEVAMLERNLADLERLDADEAEAVAAADLLKTLHSDLRDSGFLRYLLEERRSLLADLAGIHLETLTAGRYRFSPDGDFNILDLTAAEQVRAPASLSGGETFLASLALALALAEIVSREGGRLDAFFLDEGFGSLDPEHLELAMDGIERLVAARQDRLVVVVSHVGALQERFDDLIVLDRDPMTGTTRVVSGSGATE